jgi:hypothetical protein
MSAGEVTNFYLIQHSISTNIRSHIIIQRCLSAFYQQQERTACLSIVGLLSGYFRTTLSATVCIVNTG